MFTQTHGNLHSGMLKYVLHLLLKCFFLVFNSRALRCELFVIANFFLRFLYYTSNFVYITLSICHDVS